MKLFLDTEFADFADADLISIGLVSDDDRMFYGERNDFRRCACSDFVRQVVLPQLGREPMDVHSRAGLRDALRRWLMQFEANAPVLICADFGGDWTLFVDLLDSDIPTWISFQNIWREIDDLVLENFFFESGLQDHHALNDAIANRVAYRPRVSKVMIIDTLTPFEKITVL